MEAVLSHRVCPWWVGYFLASPLRRLMLDPEKVIGPFVREGMTVLEPGPGMGFFTLELARLVGPSGRVVAVDIQPRMLAGLQRGEIKEGVPRRVKTRQAAADSLNIADLKEHVDFTLAFAVVHEMPSASRFFAEAAQASKPGVVAGRTFGSCERNGIQGRTGGRGASGILSCGESGVSKQPRRVI